MIAKKTTSALPKENGFDEESIFSAGRWILLVVIIWIGFWSSFFAFNTNMNPVLGLCSVSYSFLAIFILPFVMWLSLIIRKSDLKSSNSLQDEESISPNSNIHLIVKVTIGFLLSFAYEMIIGMILSTLSIYNTIFVLLLQVLLPLIICFARRSIIREFVSFFFGILSKWNLIRVTIVVSLISLVIRFPIFINSEIGVDSFVFHMLIEDLLESGTLTWVLNPLSFVEFYPASVIPSSIFYVGNIVFLTGLEIETAIFVCSVAVGLVSTLSFVVLLQVAKKFQLIHERMIPYSLALYAFMPLLLKFTDWTTSGRQIFLLIAPCAFALILINSFDKTSSKSVGLLRWILLAFILIVVHGLGRIVLVFAIFLQLTLILSNQSFWSGIRKSTKISVLRNTIRKFAGNIEFTDKLIITLIGLFLLILPYGLLVFGNKVLVGTWMFTRSSITSALPFNPITAAVAFLFIFSARLGLVSPFLFIGLLYLPFSQAEISTNTKYLLLTSFLFFPFLPFVLYIYQALAVIFVPIAVILFLPLLDSVYKMFQNRFNEYFGGRHPQTTVTIRVPLLEIEISSSSRKRKKKSTKKFCTFQSYCFLFIIICAGFGASIQLYRYSYEGAAFSSDLGEIIDTLGITSNNPVRPISLSNWTLHQFEEEDRLTYEEDFVNFTSTYSGLNETGDWIYVNITEIRGPMIIVEVRCMIVNESIVGPYLKVANVSNLQGTGYEQWTLAGISDWRVLRFNITDIDRVNSIGFGILPTETHSGPASLLIDYVTIESHQASILASNQGLAQTIGAHLPDSLVFPMSDILVFSTYGTLVNYTVDFVDIQFTITVLVSILRKGLFEIDIDVFDEFHRVADSGTFEEFSIYNDIFRVEFLCHLRSDNWDLLDNLLNANATTLIQTEGNYDLYRVISN